MKRKSKFIISLLVLFLVASLVFFGYYIFKNEYSKRVPNRNGINGFDASKINVDLIKDDVEFARAIPEYKMRFSGLTDRQFDLTFLDIVSNYKDKVINFTATGTSVSLSRNCEKPLFLCGILEKSVVYTNTINLRPVIV